MRDDFGWTEALVAITVCAVLMALSYSWGWEDCRTSMQQEAAAHNAAHWETASDGSTTFVWDEEVSDEETR